MAAGVLVNNAVVFPLEGAPLVGGVVPHLNNGTGTGGREVRCAERPVLEGEVLGMVVVGRLAVGRHVDRGAHLASWGLSLLFFLLFQSILDVASGSWPQTVKSQYVLHVLDASCCGRDLVPCLASVLWETTDARHTRVWGSLFLLDIRV